jgi:hypothetical protein
MTLTDEDKHWIEAAMEDSSKRFGTLNFFAELKRRAPVGAK